MSDTNGETTAANPFADAWSSFLSQMGVPSGGRVSAATEAPSWSDDAMRQMQRAFMDALANYCDEYLRSPAYLTLMKQTMDNALTFRQQVDTFLAEAHRATHTPSTDDLNDITAALRRIEDRLDGRLDEFERRIGAVEAGRPTGASAVGAAKRHAHGSGPAGDRKTKVDSKRTEKKSRT